MMVRAFDGLKSEVLTDIDLELEIRPYMLLVHF